MRGVRGRRLDRSVLVVTAVAAALVAVLLAWVGRPGNAEGWVTVLSGILGPPALWVSMRQPPGARGEPDLDKAVTQLSRDLRAQWVPELAQRRVNDPYLLVVRWEAAPEHLVYDWPVLVRLASTAGAGWSQPAPAWRWASGPDPLASSGGGLAEVLDLVPTGRLLVLGEAGAGKSVLLLRLVLDLLAARQPGEPVPFLVQLAGWDPTSQGLYDWLEDRLAADHALLAAHPAGPDGPRLAHALLTANLIIPVLDGLDELPADVRRLAVVQINDGVWPGVRLVVASRRDAFEEVVSPASGPGVRLTGAAGIQLCPLETTEVAAYLGDSSAGRTAEQRWAPVLAALETPARDTPGTPVAPVAQVLITPLAVALARTIYNPRPGEEISGVPDPAELVDPVRFPDRDAVWRHLFDGFVPAAYRPRPGPSDRDRWRTADAVRWLGFLARHLERDRRGAPDLLWWHLPTAVPAQRRIWAAARPPVLIWLALVLVAFGPDAVATAWHCVDQSSLRPVTSIERAEVGAGAVTLVSLLLVVFLPYWWLFEGLHGIGQWGRRTPARTVRWKPSRRCGLAAGCVGLVVSLWTAVSVLDGYAERTLDSSAAWTLGGRILAAASLAVLAVLVVGGLRGVESDEGGPEGGQDAGLAADRRVSWRLGLGAGVAVWLAGWIIVGMIVQADRDWAIGSAAFGWRGALLAAVVLGPPAATAVAGARTAWGAFALAGGYLARRGELPRDLLGFLDDAYDRGVLRRAGSAYQFRHVELQRRLAGHSPHPAADQLADEVAAVLSADLRGRTPRGGLLDLAWRPAGLDVQQDWAERRRQTTDGSHPRPDPGPEAFAGAGYRLLSTFDTVPTGRLVVLGEAGSGKTTLLVRLVLDLLARRTQGEQVPFLVPVSSWDPRRQRLDAWLETSLLHEYLWLGKTTAGVSKARALLDAGRILPVLDGFDRLRPAVRAAAIGAINDLMRSGGRVVLASRGDAFAQAVLEEPARPRFLDGAAVVRLLPLDPLDTARRVESWEPHRPQRWAPVTTALRAAGRGADGGAHRSPAADALSTPLATYLLQAGYTRRRDAADPPEPDLPEPDPADPRLPDPAELCEQGELPSRRAVERRLVDRFLAAAYRPPRDGVGVGAWTATQAVPVLTFLARYLNRTGTTRIEWWNIVDAVPPRARHAATALPTGLLFGLLVAADSLIAGLVYGAVGAVAAAVGISSTRHHRLSISPGARRRHASGPGTELTPVSAVAAIRASTVRVLFPLCVALAAGFFGLLPMLGSSPWDSPRGIVVGALLGVVLTFGASPWGAFVFARCWLTVVHRLPFDLVGFLADAHERGVLGQTASAWEFRFAALPARLTEADD